LLSGKFKSHVMATSVRYNKNIQCWLVVIGLAVVLVITGICCNSKQGSSDPNDILRDAIVQGIQSNIAKLYSVALEWRSERKGFGPWSSKPEHTGKHQLWWNINRIAISCKRTSIVRDPNGQVSSNIETQFMTYNGKDFRIADIPTTTGGKVEVVILKKPKYRGGENYLNDVGWQGRGLITNICSKPLVTEPGTHHWSTEGKLIKWTFRNSRTGQVGVQTYDIEKAYGLVTRENYFKENVLQSRTTIQYKQVSGGAWFPVSVITEGHNIQNGELIYRNKMEIDRNKSVFNDPSAIPEDVFELKIGPNTEVTDLTSLKMKLKRFLNNF